MYLSQVGIESNLLVGDKQGTRHINRLSTFHGEVIAGVGEGDIFDHFAEQLLIIRPETFFDFFAEQVAKKPAEVFVPGVGEEAAGIGEHSDEPAQQAHIGQGIHLFGHAVHLVEEPPAGTELHLAGTGAVLEIAEHGGEDFIILGIDTVEDGFAEFILAVETVE